MDIITLLKNTKDETLSYYKSIDSSDLTKTYGQGKWNIKKILVHLADTEYTLMNRIKRTIAENKPVIYGLDPDLWSNNLDYENYPLEISENLYLGARESTIYLAEKHYLLNGKRQYIHSEVGLRTLQEEFDKVASHNRAHLDQIKNALKK